MLIRTLTRSKACKFFLSLNACSDSLPNCDDSLEKKIKEFDEKTRDSTSSKQGNSTRAKEGDSESGAISPTT
jgi:hypothetical protein